MNDSTQTRPDATPGLGHNLPSPFDERRARTDDLIVTANKWLATCTEITSDGQAERAQDFLSLLRTAQAENEKARKDETAPLRKAVEEINGRYKTLGALLDKATGVIKGLLGPWLAKIEADRRAREQAERDEANRLAREADEKARAAKTLQDQVAADAAREAAEKAAARAEAASREKAQVRGEVSGRATGFRTAWKATAITDLDEAFRYYRARPEVSELLLRLASADARAGRRRIPGFKVEGIQSVA